MSAVRGSKIDIVILIQFIFGRPFVKRFALFYQTVVLSVRPVCLSVTLVYCRQTVERMKMKLGTEVGLGPDHIVLDGDPTSPKGAQPLSQYSAHICCGQTAESIKMQLGMAVGLGPGDFVLDEDPAPPPLPQKGGGGCPPIFCPCLLCTNDCMDQDETWHRGRPRPWPHCVR